jgi:hypothetical protein
VQERVRMFLFGWILLEACCGLLSGSRDFSVPLFFKKEKKSREPDKNVFFQKEKTFPAP